ncbi:hypothetical protein [Bradyrhizobium sp. WSM1253]|uniref:hypothetical protein n=1 Tax=Bradyrhizobium sp. WSM1253 TaxID=319003 RepID=UPI00025D2E36|nr:hypothetical protein [Bradyrhizobium sp. WSM1253]EIG62911.1 hypothetical protein Bra1253DRAFT_07855 [Bradyrhizobium sp. WSM1253]
MSEFKLRNCELFFQPADSEELVSLGSCDPKDVLMTTTFDFGGKKIAQSFRPGDDVSVKMATNELAALVIGRRDPMLITEHGVDEHGRWYAKAEPKAPCPEEEN